MSMRALIKSINIIHDTFSILMHLTGQCELKQSVIPAKKIIQEYLRNTIEILTQIQLQLIELSDTQ